LEIIDLNGHTIGFTVSPMQATVLSYFEDQVHLVVSIHSPESTQQYIDSWFVAALAKAMDVEVEVVTKQSQFWCHQGVLRYTQNGHDQLVLNTAYTRPALTADKDSSNEHLLEATSVSSKRQAEAEIKVKHKIDCECTLELYIKGMLRQFETLSSPQIAAKLALIARSEQMHSGTCKATIGAQNSNDSVQGNSGLLAAHNNECAAKLRIFASLIGSWSHPTFMKVF
ncbi:hypothetical protein DYB26_015269, partial [Aphanomyces astaci]